MTEPENFLSRWSRRKLEGEPEASPSDRPGDGADLEQGANPQPPDEATETNESAALDSRLRGNERSAAVDESKEPAFDITTLPSIESITAQTDIRVFMQKGVPAALTRAALRRAWVADPGIRDFIEMAENQWDFATGADLPGFGPLDASAEDIRRMVADVFGNVPKPAAETEAATANPPEPAEETGQLESAASNQQPPASQDVSDAQPDQTLAEDVSTDAPQDVVQRNTVDVAMQQSNAVSESGTLPARRPHGRALPQ